MLLEIPSSPSFAASPTSPLTSLEIDLVPPINDPPPLSIGSNASNANNPSLLIKQLSVPTPAAFRVCHFSAAMMQDCSVQSSTDTKLSYQECKKIWMRLHQDLAWASAATTKSCTPKAHTINKYVCLATACSVDFDVQNLKHTQFSWTGGKDSFSHHHIYTLEEMVGPWSIFDFTLQNWDRKYISISMAHVSQCSKFCRSSVPITDHKECVIAVLAGSPDDKGWHKVHWEAADALKQSHDKLKKPSERDLKHQEQRGHFIQEAAGESMGGSQKVDYSLLIICTHWIYPGSRNSSVYKQSHFPYYGSHLLCLHCQVSVW